MKIKDLNYYEAFLAVATRGGFSAASRSLRVPLPQVSKRVARLEAELGIRLFNRTTRVVTLTDEGKALVPKIQAIVEDLREAEALFSDKTALSGTVRVTAAPFVAHRLVLPLLAEFMALHPHLHIEMDVTEAFANLVEDGFDMAIRIETPKDSGLVYRRLAPNDLIFCAAPSYLKRHATPIKTPADLNVHHLLMLGVHRRCRFKRDDMALGEVAGMKRLSCENGAFLTEAALGGMGVLVRSIWDVREHLKEGRLVQVLKNHPLETFGHIHAVVPSKRYLAPRVRALFDFVVEGAKSWKIN